METRQLLIEHAMKEIEQKGLDGFSLRAVGSAAGLSSMAVYRHFANKEELLRAVGEEAFKTFNTRASAISSASLQSWVRALARVYVEFYLDTPGRFDACFVVRTSVERIYPQGFRSGKSPVISMMAERLAAAQAEGQLVRTDALELALQIWAQVHGLVALHKAGRFSLSRKDFIALCERAAMRLVDAAASDQSRPAQRTRTRAQSSR
jgi:AcrR family transcriptional regulator